MTVRCLALADAVERLQAPAAEAWSVLTGAPLLAIEVGATDVVLEPDAIATAVRRLGALPCPVIAFAPNGPAPAVRALLEACDVVVATRDELTACADGIGAAPLAAATLVQVLRAGVGLAPADGLVLESLAYATLQAGPEFGCWLAARSRRSTPRPTTAPVVRLERGAEELTITLDRPDRHNAFSARMRDALAEALALAAIDPSLAVVLRGNGPSFCSGGDLDEFGTLSDPATAHLVRTTRSPARLLAEIGARVRAEVHGACVGAGIELAAFADRVVARPDTFVALPEVAMGLIPGAGGTVSLPRRIGRQRTAYLALSGRRLDVATAHAWGLVDAVDARELGGA